MRTEADSALDGWWCRWLVVQMAGYPEPLRLFEDCPSSLNVQGHVRFHLLCCGDAGVQRLLGWRPHRGVICRPVWAARLTGLRLPYSSAPASHFWAHPLRGKHITLRYSLRFGTQVTGQLTTGCRGAGRSVARLDEQIDQGGQKRIVIKVLYR